MIFDVVFCNLDAPPAADTNRLNYNDVSLEAPPETLP